MALGFGQGFALTAPGIGGGAAAPAFDPATLYGASDRGGLLDLSESAGLFSATDGTGAIAYGGAFGYVTDTGPLTKPAIQATAANRPLYRGAPRTLGTELLTNGQFTSDTGWTKGTGWTIAGGVATKAAGTGSSLSQSITVTAATDHVVFYCITRTAGSLQVKFSGGTDVLGQSRAETGSYADVMLAVTGNTAIEFVADAAFAGTVSRVSAKPVTQSVNMGGWFDGTDVLKTAAVDMSNTDKATIVFSGMWANPNIGGIVAYEVGNYFSSTPGSACLQFGSQPIFGIAGSVGLCDGALPSAEGADVPMRHVIVGRIDFAGATSADKVAATARGVELTNTYSGSAGTGNMVNGVLTLGAATNNFLHWRGFINRFGIINRELNPTEEAQFADWARQGTAYCAVIGDSTVAQNSSPYGMTNATTIASLVGGMVVGRADLSTPGDKIADQKTKWTALPGKGALEAVFIQIGLNDVRSRVGSNLATAAEVIADLQDLVTTVRAGVPAACKIYLCGITPCKAWLDGAANASAANAAWLAVNEAIAGNGGTPITGVDARITSHVAALNDGSGNLLARYDHNDDGVHESNEARFLIGQLWQAQLEADGLV